MHVLCWTPLTCPISMIWQDIAFAHHSTIQGHLHAPNLDIDAPEGMEYLQVASLPEYMKRGLYGCGCFITACMPFLS